MVLLVDPLTFLNFCHTTHSVITASLVVTALASIHSHTFTTDIPGRLSIELPAVNHMSWSRPWNHYLKSYRTSGLIYALHSWWPSSPGVIHPECSLLCVQPKHNRRMRLLLNSSHSLCKLCSLLGQWDSAIRASDWRRRVVGMIWSGNLWYVEVYIGVLLQQLLGNGELLLIMNLYKRYALLAQSRSCRLRVECIYGSWSILTLQESYVAYV